MELSNCCGAIINLQGLCSECLEHCDALDTNEDDND